MLKSDEDLGYNVFFSPDEELDLRSECGKNHNLTPKQMFIVEILHWIRNKNIGKEGAINLKIFPGPHGIINKRGWWWPSPKEACDANISPHMIEGHVTEGHTEKRKVVAWVYYKHCKTRQHIEYLVAHRLAYVLQSCINGNMLIMLATVCSKRRYPLYINDENPLIRLFVKDLLSKQLVLSPHLTVNLVRREYAT